MQEIKPYYQIIVDRVNNLDTIELKVEVDEQFFTDKISQLQAIRARLYENLHSATGLGIKVTLLSDNWLKILEKDNQIHYITGYQFDINNHGIGNIMDDKGLFWDILKYKNIPVIEQYIIFHDYDKNKALEYFNLHNQKIIVKGNIGNAGI